MFIATREVVCNGCGENPGSHAWIMLAGERGALLGEGYDRHDARTEVPAEIDPVLYCIAGGNRINPP